MLSNPPSKHEIEATIQQEILRVLQDKDAAAAPPAITQDSRLGSDLGMSSLDLAQLVSLLEMSLNGDPFQSLVPITSVRTVGDLYKAYDKLFSGQPGDSEDNSDLLASRQRAEERRKRAQR